MGHIPTPDYPALAREVRNWSKVVVSASTALLRIQAPMDRLGMLRTSIEQAEALLRHLRDARDATIAEVAQNGEYGYTRIGESAGVSRSFAARVAREAGVKPRHVLERTSTDRVI